MKERNQSIDAVKGIAIVLVMLGHVFVHNHMEDPYLYDFIRAVQMPLFMIVSGYLCGQGKKITNLREYAGRIRKRAISYLVPFFAWLTFMHLGNLGYAYRTIFVQLDYGLWFLMVLFLLTFQVSTAQLLTAWLRKKEGMLREFLFWGIYGALCLIPLGQLLLGNSFLSPGLLINYLPFYVLGYGAGAYKKLFFKKDSRIYAVGAVLCFLGTWYLAAAFDLNSMETKRDLLIQMSASLLGSVSIIYGVCRMPAGKGKAFFAWLGNYTLEIYVIHYHFANLLNFKDRQYDFATLEGVLFVAASFLAMSAITFCCIWAMKKVRWIDRIFFGKMGRNDTNEKKS